MKSNFEKSCKRLDKQTELFTVSELHTKMYLCAEKRSQCLLLKYNEKAVRIELPEFNFFHR